MELITSIDAATSDLFIEMDKALSSRVSWGRTGLA